MQLLIIGITIAVAAFTAALVAKGPETQQQKVFILLGPPGSGKGTQAIRLSKELNLTHISTGDLFRENISQGSELGNKAKAFMDAGQLVPDSLVLEMLFDRVKRTDCAQGYLLDGFPRTIPQAEALDKALEGKAQITVINLDVPDGLILKRITGRLSCKQCGSLYNRYFSPSQVEGQCDKCGGLLVQRADDTEEVIKERLHVYHQQTEPLIEYYGKKGLLITVDGNRAPDEVYQSILKATSERP